MTRYLFLKSVCMSFAYVFKPGWKDSDHVSASQNIEVTARRRFRCAQRTGELRVISLKIPISSKDFQESTIDDNRKHDPILHDCHRRGRCRYRAPRVEGTFSTSTLPARLWPPGDRSCQSPL